MASPRRDICQPQRRHRFADFRLGQVSDLLTKSSICPRNSCCSAQASWGPAFAGVTERVSEINYFPQPIMPAKAGIPLVSVHSEDQVVSPLAFPNTLERQNAFGFSANHLELRLVRNAASDLMFTRYLKNSAINSLRSALPGGRGRVMCKSQPTPPKSLTHFIVRNQLKNASSSPREK